MNLNKRPAIDARWREAMDTTLDSFLNCDIELLDMRMEDDGTDYNWKTNTGGLAQPTQLFMGPAQFQIYRFTLTMDAPVGSVDQVRSGRFTVKHKGIQGVDVRKGQMIRILSCPSDESLERYEYVVNSGINSGSSARRTIEVEINMSRVI